MASFVVLTPPDDGELSERAVFIRDGFSVLALFFHVIWLLWHRLWFAAALLVLILVGLIAAVDAFPQWSLLVVVTWLVLVWFVALEGNGMRIAKKERQGWRTKVVIEAQNAATAEEIFYTADQRGQSGASRMAAEGDGEKRAVLKPRRNQTPESGPALGLLGFHERH